VRYFGQDRPPRILLFDENEQLLARLFFRLDQTLLRPSEVRPGRTEVDVNLHIESFREVLLQLRNNKPLDFGFNAGANLAAIKTEAGEGKKPGHKET